MKGLWILPTRRRLVKLQSFFDAAVKNGMSTPGIVLVQTDELVELRAEYDALKMPANWRIMPTTADGMGDKYREIWDAAQKLDWVGIACDDLRPQTHGWDRMLLSNLTDKNVVSCADGIQGPLRMSGITIFSGGLLRAIGFIYAPGLWHTFQDDCWESLGRATGCWSYVQGVTVTHDHPFRDQKIDPALADDTTYKSYGRQEQDKAAYLKWRAEDFEACCERIRKCQAA